MKAASPFTEIKYWRNERFFNIGFASYTLTDHSFPRHFHEHYVIELVVQGGDQFYCNGKQHTAVSDELVFINPGEVHTGSTLTGGSLHYYSLTPDVLELNEIADALDKPLPKDFCFQHTLTHQPQLARKMHAFFNVIDTCADSLQCEELFSELMHALITIAINNTEENFNTPVKDARVKQLIDFMHASSHKPVTLQQMADCIHTSTFHLIRLFKKATGLSPYEYLLSLRTEHAKQLLQKGSSIKDAAWEAGFYDASHFNRLFRKVSGTKPKIFRSSK